MQTLEEKMLLKLYFIILLIYTLQKGPPISSYYARTIVCISLFAKSLMVFSKVGNRAFCVLNFIHDDTSAISPYKVSLRYV